MLRADAAAEDVAVLLTALGPAYALGGEAWRRYLALLLDGLRATDRPLAYVPEVERRELLARRQDPRPAHLSFR